MARLAPEWAARLSRADQALRRLGSIRKRCPTLDRYLRDADARDVVERNFQIVVQALIDVSTELIERNRWGRPANAVKAVGEIVQRGLLPRRCRIPLRSMIRLRNVLVHEYATIDSAKVYGALKRGPPVLSAALSQLGRALARISP